MNKMCKCGGRMVRTDLAHIYSEKYKRVMIHDTDPLVAHFACNKCGEKSEQRKRQPKPPVKVDGPSEVESFIKRIQAHLENNRKGYIAFYQLVDKIAGDCKIWQDGRCYLDDRAEKKCQF